MVSRGIKGSPYIRIVVTEVSTCRRIFICISISASPLSVLGKAKFSFIFRPRSSDLIAPTPSVIYILSRVFSFIRHVPRTRFSPAGNNTLDSPPVTPLYSTPSWRERIVFLLAVEIPKALDAPPLTRRRRRELLLLPIPSFLTSAYDIGANEKGVVWYAY